MAMPKVANPASDSLAYNKDLRADIETDVNEKPRARVHSVEWRKIMIGEPVEINPSIGHGFKIMSVDEWASRWKRNDDFPVCLKCGSNDTKEHHFTQVCYCYALNLDGDWLRWVHSFPNVLIANTVSDYRLAGHLVLGVV